MTRDSQPISPLVTHVDVSANSNTGSEMQSESGDETTGLLRQMLAAQDRQNELLEELVHQLGAAQKQKASELGQWKQANPRLARRCRKAAESLGRVQTDFLDQLTEDISSTADDLSESDFMLNEFVDRYGPRLAHLNGVLQVLSQLSSMPDATNSQ